MDVSVVVPAYNAQETIRRCVESILGQEDVDLELIVVDDGSTDGTGALLDEMAAADSRLHVVHQKNRGRSAARNAGMDLARGTWIAFCDADDYYLPGALRHLLDLEVEGCSALWGGYSFPGNPEGDSEMQYVLEPRLILHAIIQVDLRAGEAQGGYRLVFDGIVEHSACFKLYRRSIVEELGLRFREELCYAEDALFNVAFLTSCGGKIAVTSAVVYWYDIDFCQTWATLKESNVKLLPTFADIAREILEPARDVAGCSEEETERFVGYVTQMVLWNAIYKGPSTKETAALLEPVMRDERVWGAWEIYAPNYPRRRLMKSTQQWLIDHGQMRLAIRLGRVVHGIWR